MPLTTIDEAETAFVMRKFARSLRIANSVLEGGCNGDEPACCGPAADGRREVHPAVHVESDGDAGDAVDGGDVIRCHSALVPGPSPNRSRMDVMTLSATASSSPRSAADPPLDTPDASSSWRVRLTNASSVYDRAAAIAIQSIYEIESAGGQSVGGSSNHADDERRNEHIISDLSTLHQYYCTASMPIGLACIYIQFCAAMGWRGVALSLATDLLGHILVDKQPGSTSSGFQEELLTEDWFLNACEELIDLALTELLPRVKEGKDCRALLYRLQGQNQLDHSSTTQPITLCEEVQPSSVDVLMRNLADDLPSAFHPCFEDIFEQCNDKLGQIQLVSTKDHVDTASDDSSKDGSAVGLMSAADKVLARSAATAASTDTSDEHAHEGPLPSASQSLSELFQSNIVEPLWESEDRWTNRAAVVAVGVSSVMLWRRRRRIGAALRSTGKAAVAPFREIVEAIALPQAQK